jgi:hypothetical protein
MGAAAETVPRVNHLTIGRDRFMIIRPKVGGKSDGTLCRFTEGFRAGDSANESGAYGLVPPLGGKPENGAPVIWINSDS